MRKIVLSLAAMEQPASLTPPNRGTFHLGMLLLAKMEITMRGKAICLAGLSLWAWELRPPQPA